MPLEVENPNKRNTLSIGWGTSRVEGRIKFTGQGSVVQIARGCAASSINFEIGSNVVVSIGARCRLGALMIYATDHTRVTIGERSSFNGMARLLLHEKGKIDIGSSCLVAAHTDVTISDMHSILDAASGARINPAADISIADHVWIGEGALILKGVSIGPDSIVSARAVVTHDMPGGVVAAGVPARIVRQGVTWDFALK